MAGFRGIEGAGRDFTGGTGASRVAGGGLVDASRELAKLGGNVPGLSGFGSKPKGNDALMRVIGRLRNNQSAKGFGQPETHQIGPANQHNFLQQMLSEVGAGVRQNINQGVERLRNPFGTPSVTPKTSVNPLSTPVSNPFFNNSSGNILDSTLREADDDLKKAELANLLGLV